MSPGRGFAFDAEGVLDAPFRGIAATILGAFAVAAAINVATGWMSTALVAGLGACAGAVAIHLNRSGRRDAAAMVAFYGLALALLGLALVGNGTRDFGIVGFPAFLFLGCVFLAPGPYWGLVGLALAGVCALAAGEMTGLLPQPSHTRTDLRALTNLAVVIGGCGVGGRALLSAIRTSLGRQTALRGELSTTRDRMEKVFQSTQSPMVVSRLRDGTYLEVNDAYLRLFGYRRDAVIGKSSLALNVWEDPQDRERFVREMGEKRRVDLFETRLRKSSGEVIEAQLSAEVLALEGEDWLVISTADVTALREAERRAEYLFTRDALTGLPNRVLALDRLQSALQYARRSGRCVAVMHIDLDRFARVNETLGRDGGDAMLRDFVARIDAVRREADTLARIGGDEFLFVAGDVADPADAEKFAARILAAARAPFEHAGQVVRCDCSVGVAISPRDATDAESLLRLAETAMQFAKGEGGARLNLFDREMGERLRDRLRLESSLRTAVARGELSLAFQPKFDVLTRRVTGMEALARWTHPELGAVPPSRFIAIAEESDLIRELGAWVLHEGCRQMGRWGRDGAAGVPVAMNLSARQLTADLPDQVVEAARAGGIEPASVELEVTESMLIANPESTRRVLRQAAARGCRITLDDFGVGFSSLNYLKHLDLDSLKVDRSFVRDVVSNPADGAIIAAITGLAHGLGLRVIGEGVETEEQLAALRELGCDEVQGYLMCEPLAPEEVARRFLRGAAASG